MRRLLVVLLLAALALSGTASARCKGFCGGIIYDPTNHVVNTVEAIRQLAREAQEIQGEITRLLKLKELIKATAKMGVDELMKISNIDKQIEQLRQVSGFTWQLDAALGEGKREADALISLYSASSLDFKSYVDKQVSLAQAGNESAKRLFDTALAVNDSIRTAMDARQAAIAAVGNAGGETMAWQARVGVLDLAAGEQAKMIQLFAERMKARAERKIIDAALKKDNVQAAERWATDWQKRGVAAQR
jgi:hypothetical protein